MGGMRLSWREIIRRSTPLILTFTLFFIIFMLSGREDVVCGPGLVEVDADAVTHRQRFQNSSGSCLFKEEMMGDGANTFNFSNAAGGLFDITGGGAPTFRCDMDLTGHSLLNVNGSAFNVNSSDYWDGVDTPADFTSQVKTTSGLVAEGGFLANQSGVGFWSNASIVGLGEITRNSDSWGVWTNPSGNCTVIGNYSTFLANC